MNTIIQTLKLGMVNCYFLKQESCVLIDCGMPNQITQLLRAIEKTGCSPHDISLIILTHAHSDHVGCAAEIARITGARCAIHRLDAPLLAQGLLPPIRPVTRWGQFLIRFTDSPAARSMQRFKPVSPDIVFEDTPFSLHAFGIGGKVIHTPGHTPGSVSILLDSGEAFVGDSAMNGMPSLSRRPVLPIIAEDIETLKDSWRNLLNEKITTVYPGHGKPYPAQDMARYL